MYLSLHCHYQYQRRVYSLPCAEKMAKMGGKGVWGGGGGRGRLCIYRYTVTTSTSNGYIASPVQRRWQRWVEAVNLAPSPAREEKMAKMDRSSCPSTQHRWFYRPLNKPAASTSEERLAKGRWVGGWGRMGSEGGGGSEPTSVPAGRGSHHETAALSLPALPWT